LAIKLYQRNITERDGNNIHTNQKHLGKPNAHSLTADVNNMCSPQGLSVAHWTSHSTF